jgi:hypothetical protein
MSGFEPIELAVTSRRAIPTSPTTLYFAIHPSYLATHPLFLKIEYFFIQPPASTYKDILDIRAAVHLRNFTRINFVL